MLRFGFYQGWGCVNGGRVVVDGGLRRSGFRRGWDSIASRVPSRVGGWPLTVAAIEVRFVNCGYVNGGFKRINYSRDKKLHES